MTQIINRWNGNVIAEGEMNLRGLVVHAVKNGANLYGASLDGANLYGANLYGASLVRANLYGASLYGASLVRANLDGANLDGASLVRANLYGASLYGANLDGANLYGASLDGANLYGASLDGANLYGANLYGASLVRANLDGANLDGASLVRANLYGANLDGAMNMVKTMGVEPGNYYWKRFNSGLKNNDYQFYVGLNELRSGEVFASDDSKTYSYPGFHFASRSWCASNYGDRPLEAKIQIPIDAQINEPWATDGKASADKIIILQVFEVATGTDVTDKYRRP